MNDQQASLHVRFAKSETVFRVHYPPKAGDHIGDKYFTGRRWVRQNKKGIRRARAGQ